MVIVSPGVRLRIFTIRRSAGAPAKNVLVFLRLNVTRIGANGDSAFTVFGVESQ